MCVGALFRSLLLGYVVHAKVDHRVDDVANGRQKHRLAFLMLALGPGTKSPASRQSLNDFKSHQRIDNSKSTMQLEDAFEWLKKVSAPEGAEDFSKKKMKEDDITPFDKFMGIQPQFVDAEGEALDEDDASNQYVDPTDASNYITVEVGKPSGLFLEETLVDDDGPLIVYSVYIDEVDAEGPAAASNLPIKKQDQIVGIDSTNTRGMNMDSLFDLVETTGETYKLTLFRGPTKFLYGPTAPDDEWYKNLLDERGR